MNRFYLFISIFLIYFSCVAQSGSDCINVSGSKCLGQNDLTNLVIGPTSLCGNTNLEQWTIIDSEGNQIGLPDVNIVGNVINFTVDENGLDIYTISDGLGNTIQYEVLPMPSFNSTITPEYYICNDSVIIDFEILPESAFNDFSWSGSATDNASNGQFGDCCANTFTATYFNSGEYSLNA